MRIRAKAALVGVGLALLVGRGEAWEADTTHAGLTEQAALASSLHERLRVQFGRENGLFESLTVPPADAPELFEVLRRLNPTHGHVPDGRGKLHALGWLVAGSAVADSPAWMAAQHFFDPTTGSGLSESSLRGLLKRARHRLMTLVSRQTLERGGIAAPEWLEHPDNPLGMRGFRDQYRKAVSARTPGERGRHLAGALIAAGAMVHVLEDMGSPSHARNDLAAHLDRLGPDPADVESRFERVAALGYGRMGVPAPARAAAVRPLREFFTAKDGSGLADRTAARWFSAYTLPRTIELGGDPRGALQGRLSGSLRRPAPVPPMDLDLAAAEEEGGAVLTGTGGACAAKYRVEERRLSWFIDDACALEQVAAILPEVASYAAGMIDTLFRGTLSFEAGAGGALTLRAGVVALGAGTITVFWDDARGVRTQLSTATVKGAAQSGVVLELAVPPADARRVSALFDGVDGAGQPLLATGTALHPL
jgi:hypothetical protein